MTPGLPFIQFVGSQIWPATYGSGSDDAGCLAWIIANMREEWIRTDGISMALHAATWVHAGCPILEADEKYFAAMAQTNLGSGAGEELRIPWQSFAVRLPKGLIVAADGTSYTNVTVGQFTALRALGPDDDRTFAFLSINSDHGPSLFEYEPMPLTRLLFQETVDHSNDDNPITQYMQTLVNEADSSDAEIRRLVRRAIVGLLYTLQHTNNWKHGSTFSRVGKSKGREPPAHRAIVIGKPLSIDVRTAVRDSARTGRGAPSVQTLVRGHIKRQVIGVGRNGRKVIWVDLYWRGPEDAPILSRPIKLGPSQ